MEASPASEVARDEPFSRRSPGAGLLDAVLEHSNGMFVSIEPVHAVVGVLGVCLLAAVGVTAGLSPPPVSAPPRSSVVGVAPGPGSASVDLALAAPVGDEAGAAGATPSRVSDAWVESVSTATGIPARAVQAYADATLTVAAENPGCGLGWTTLAAIGAVESGHGTSGRTRLGGDGRPLTPILGPALDGRDGFAALPADDASRRWTGDAQWQRAVGPMQFLPSTWERWGADGDGDGVADPNDIDDAALAAGRYLCAAGGNLTTGAGWSRAVQAYNHSDAYVAQVRALADGYAAVR